MAKDTQSRRRFMSQAGVVVGGVLGSTIPLERVAAQGARQGPSSKGERFRAALTDPQGLVLPVVNSVLMARLCEMEGFSAGFMGGSGFAAMHGLPNNGLGTLTEVMTYMNLVVENTNLPLLVDAEDGGGSPLIVYRVIQGFERAGAACVMIEDSIDARSNFNGKGAPMASPVDMANRVKAAVDARKDPAMMILVRCNAPAKGYPEQHSFDLASACAEAGADGFYFSGFTLEQQQRAKSLFKKPLMIGSSGPAAEWKTKGLDMAYYHVETVGIGAVHMALKELKTTGRFSESAKMQLSGEINARLSEQAVWQARAKKYGVTM
jgi:2-methylisocitrate lyase-like PEP mutase family enzyme